MKRIFLSFLILLTAAFSLTSCNNPAPGNSTANNSASANNANVAATNNGTATGSATSEADVKKLVNDVATALNKNDADALDKFYAADYVLTNQDGSMQTRAERLAAIKSGDMKYESFSYSDVNVRTYGDTAVVTAIANLKAANKGKPVEGKFRVSSVWVKGKSGWQQVNAQATEIK